MYKCVVYTNIHVGCNMYDSSRRTGNTGHFSWLPAAARAMRRPLATATYNLSRSDPTTSDD